MVKKISKDASAATAATDTSDVSSSASMPDLSAFMAALPQMGKLAGNMKESAQQIWLAGMGAFAKAQGEGGKVFETLVKEGMNLQRKTTSLAEEKVAEVTGRMTAMADTVANSVAGRAGQNWDKLEAIFEQRTAKALGRLGVPSAKDIQDLAERVDHLTLAVQRLAGNTKARAAKAPATVVKKALKKVVKAASKSVSPVSLKTIRTTVRKSVAK